MKNLFKIFAHFKTIKDDPTNFVLWFLTAIILSLSSFWIPLVSGYIINKDFYCKLMENNPFVVFSIVLLSNSILYSINHIGSGSNNFAVALRGTTLVLTIMFLVLLSTVIPMKLVSNISLDYKTQFILLTIAILLSVFVYGFRSPKWEKSVDEAVKEQDNKVEEIFEKGEVTTTDSGDIQL